jgi:hypothetical protein
MNAPWSFTIPWSIAKVFLAKSTVNKITICGDNYSKKMWLHFNKNQIEKQFGGDAPDLNDKYW